MAQRRPPTDSERVEETPEQLKALERYLEALDAAYAAAITKLYGGGLPDWVPEPVVMRVRQAIDSLQKAGQSDERISEVVALERECRLEIPAVQDPINFYDSVNYLAHVQWALSLDKANAIKELAGKRAAQDYLRSKRGNEALYGTDAELQSRNHDIRAQAAALRERNPKLSFNAIANKLAPGADLSAVQIKRILRSSTLPKKR